MNNSSAFQLPLQFDDGLSESSQYLDMNASFGSFTILMMNRRRKTSQHCFKLEELPDVLPAFVDMAIRSNHSIYISQASFANFNRRRSSFLSTSCIFLDLDTYNIPELVGLSRQELLDMIYLHCESLNIPLPSLTICSGRGFYVKWFLQDAASRKLLPYWEAVMDTLVQSFTKFGVDTRARDISRVLTVVGSTNIKHNSKCEIVGVNFAKGSQTSIQRCTLNDFQPLLPYSIAECRAFGYHAATAKRERARYQNGAIILDVLKQFEVSGHLDSITPISLNNHIRGMLGVSQFSVPDCEFFLGRFRAQARRVKSQSTKQRHNVVRAGSRFQLARMNWARYQDICRLMEYRRERGLIKDGQMNESVWIAATCYAQSKLQNNIEDIEKMIIDVALNIAPHWTAERAKNCLSSVMERVVDSKKAKSNGVSVGRGRGLYRFRDDTVIDKLDITSGELSLKRGDDYLLNGFLGSQERDRRDPMRKERRKVQVATSAERNRRAKGVVARVEYNESVSKSVESKKSAVINLKAKGATNQAIASELGISIRSVEQYTAGFDKKGYLAAEVKRLKQAGHKNNAIAANLGVSLRSVSNYLKV